jgi:hypothetical protein
MAGPQHTISVSEIQHLLREAAMDSAVATATWCATRTSSGPTTHDHTARFEEALACIAARATDRGWDLLPPSALDARAPIAWAIHEIMEWAEHLIMYGESGDHLSRVPITWLPSGAHPLGTRDLAAAVEERAELLRGELANYAVIVRSDGAPDLAA